MPQVKEFLKVLDDIDYSKSRYEKFSDFLALSFNSMSKPFCFDNTKAERREKAYMGVVTKYTCRGDKGYEAVREKFPKLLILTVEGLETKLDDFLGRVAGEGEFLNSNLGQFFTPYSLSYMNACMILGDVDKKLKKLNYLTIDEPACGSGGMLIAAADFIRTNAKEARLHTDFWVRGTDLSQNCYHMAYIQCALAGLAGEIRWGNTLTLEVFDTALLPCSVEFIARRGLPNWGNNKKKNIRHRELPKMKTIRSR